MKRLTFKQLKRRFDLGDAMTLTLPNGDGGFVTAIRKNGRRIEILTLDARWLPIAGGYLMGAPAPGASGFLVRIHN